MPASSKLEDTPEKPAAVLGNSGEVQAQVADNTEEIQTAGDAEVSEVGGKPGEEIEAAGNPPKIEDGGKSEKIEAGNNSEVLPDQNGKTDAARLLDMEASCPIYLRVKVSLNLSSTAQCT